MAEDIEVVELVKPPVLRRDKNDDGSEAGVLRENIPQTAHSSTRTHSNLNNHFGPGNSFTGPSVQYIANASIIQGNVIHGPEYVNTPNSNAGSIFRALSEGIQPVSIFTRELFNRRAQLHARRKPSNLENKRYGPYGTVRDPKVKLRLLQIARIFQFLDRGFAEYFHVALPSFGKDYIQSLLHECREDLSKSQSRDHNSTVIDLGDLGNFCEENIQTWNHSYMRTPEFSITYRRDEEMMHYLQDALEVPYWDFMVSLFLGWRSNVKSLSGDVVLRVLHGVREDLIGERHRLETEIKSSEIDQKDTSFILKGIDDRMKVLDSVWYSTESELSLIRKSAPHLEEPRRTSTAVLEIPSRHIQPRNKGHQSETVALISLVLVFLMAAIAPGYKAFALSMQDGTAGSINDADFWYLVQNSVMAVLGNIIMVVPLVRKSWFSPAYSLMWVFLTLGFAFACIAIAIYPLLNTGWSSMISFFGSISSVASVLVMTQAVAKDARQDKIKAD